MSDSEGGSNSYGPQEHLAENNEDPGASRLKLTAREAGPCFYR